VTIPIATASPWPARAAYFSAAIFITASGTTNIIYGWNKGDTLATAIVWAGVAGAVAIVFALAWPALIRSVDAKRWSAALIVLVTLLLAGTYSVTAALGSAAGGRANAAATESATTDARTKAQAAYDAAQAEMAKLPNARPVAELEALLASAKPQCRIVVTLNRRDTVCGPPAALLAELGRAKRRAELDAKIDGASAELTSIQPARIANSDAKALARYLGAVGLELTTDRLNDLLVLLGVLMIEVGGGLSLAVGMALSGPPGRTTEVSADTADGEAWTARTLSASVPDALPDTAPGQPGHSRPVIPDRCPASTVQPSDLTQWLRLQGGRAETSMRRLASALGRSRSGVHEELRRLVASGLVTAACGPRGTVLATVDGATLN
jgi:hypothetical protein